MKFKVLQTTYRMMHSSQFFSLLAAISLCLACSSRAQDLPPVKVRFISFPIIQNPKPVELLTGEGNSIDVEVPTNRISQSYKVQRPKNWVVGKTILDAEGKPSFKVYGQAPALAASEQIILLVRKGQLDEDGFEMIPFAEGQGQFGGGKYIFFNASQADIACVMGKREFAIKPKGFKLVAPDPNAVVRNKKLLHVRIFFRKNDEAVPFYSSIWRFSDKARSMVFFYHADGKPQIKLHMIRDFPA